MTAIAPFGWLLLAMLLLGSLLDCALELLNCRHFKRHAGEVPPSLEGQISSWTLERSVGYTVARAKLAAFSEMLSFLFWPILLFSGLLGYCATKLSALNAGLLLSGLLLLGAFGLARRLYEMPLELYSTFVVERKFGFCTNTLGLWLRDQCVMLLLSGAIFALLAGGALLLIGSFPSFWWLPLWLLLLCASVIGSWAFPVLIAPLFNKFEPLPDSELSSAVMDAMGKAGVGVSAVLKVDASKRTRHGNAFFAGLGPGRRIVFYDNLLSSLSREEVVAVAAHEAGHWKLGHIPKMLVASNTLFILCLYACWHLVESGALLDAFGLPHGSHATDIAVSLCLSILAFDAFVWPLTPIIYAISRRFERQADAFALKICGGGSALASALVKLSKENLSNIHPHPWYVAFKVSHPPVPERVDSLKDFPSDSSSGLR